MSEHGITSAQYMFPEPAGGYAANADVVVIRNGETETRAANDDNDNGGMLAFLADGGSIGPYQPPATTVSQVKAEAGRRIEAVFPVYKQMNTQARATELLLIGESNWTAAEQAEADYLQVARDWIKDIRDDSAVLESSLPADYQDNKHWTAWNA